MPPKQPVAGPSRPRQFPPTAPPPPPGPSLGSFSPSQAHFALALPVLGSADKVTVWDVTSDSVVSEWEVEGAGKVSTLSWSTIPSSGGGGSGKKKRRKREGGGDGEEEGLVITTERGQVFVFSLNAGVVRKWDLPTRACAAWSGERGIFLATSTSIILRLTADASSIAYTYALPPDTPLPTAISALSASPNSIQLLIASASVIVLDLDATSGKVLSSSSPFPVATSSVTALLPLPPSDMGQSFLVVADDDRTISQYTLTPGTTRARLSYRYASPTLSPAHSLALTSSRLAILHASGEVSLFLVPTELDFTRPKSDSKPNTVKLVEGKGERQARLCRVAFAPKVEGELGALICGQMTGGGRVKWSRAVYEQPEGGVNSETIVKCDVQDLVNGAAEDKSIPLQRFKAPATIGELPEQDTGEESASALPADVEMADLSLGERLLALPNDTAPNGDVHPSKSKAKPDALVLDGPVNAASLTRLLVQALHTSDPALLAVCLTTRDPVLIRNTIRKLPSSMALPLLKACVERLGQGKGAGRRGGGRGTGQSEQQGRGTVEWVKGVLVERGSLLMTMPSLPLHLANLSQLLNTRLQLYQPLLSLSGRLDLALAQINMRRIAAEQAAAMQIEQGKRAEGARYIEGESEDEDEAVVLEVGDGGGEVEDVNMMVNGTDDEDDDLQDGDVDEDDEEDEDDEDDDEDEDPLDSGDEDILLGAGAEAEESGSEAEESDDD